MQIMLKTRRGDDEKLYHVQTQQTNRADLLIAKHEEEIWDMV